jgi:hypothetical protein
MAYFGPHLEDRGHLAHRLVAVLLEVVFLLCFAFAVLGGQLGLRPSLTWEVTARLGNLLLPKH